MVRSFRFGDFHLDGSRRLLFRGGAPVALTPKAFELLELLIAERDRTLSKTELLDRLWPDTVVAENNLTVTMSALRKALGESAARPRHLQTLSRRGYRFVEAAPEDQAYSEAAPPPSRPARLVRSVAAPAGVNEGSGDGHAPRRLVGREAERAMLQERFGQCLSGRGRVVFVTGEPGIGKTALCNSCIADLAERAPELTLMRGRSLEQFGSREAYLPWLEAWAELLAGKQGERAREVLRRVAPSWCREFPAAFSSTPGLAQSPDGPELSAQRMLREMADALVALAAAAPLLIVLEDLHWADVASSDLLRLVCQRSRGQRWLILGTFRSVEAGLLNAPLENLRREALSHDECDELRLGPLGEAHVAAHLRQQFDPNDFPRELTQALFRRTEGHPLFLTRLSSFLVERGDLLQRDGRWILGRPLEQLELEAPEDVRAMLRRKLDSLNPEARQALAYASVEGNEFSSRVLAALLGVDELDVEERLHALWSVHRLIEVLGEEEEEEWEDRQPSTRYRFAHVLYQNELYDGLPPRRRAHLHQRTAAVLLTHSEAGRQRLAATLAVHFERARDFPRAIEYFEAAAENANRLCAYAEVARHSARALELCRQLPAAERARHSPSLYHRLGWALHSAGQPARARATFRELVEYARASGQPEAECDGLHCLAALAWFAGQIEECRAITQEGLETAKSRGLRYHEMLALVGLTGATAGAGDIVEARRLAEAALPELEQLGDGHVLACGFINLGWTRSFQSEFAAADAAYGRAGELWGERGAHVMCMDAWSALGWVRASRGHISAGLRAFEKASEIARRHLHLSQVLRFADGTGWILREIGDVPAARAHDLAGLERARAHAVRFGELGYSIQLAEDLSAAQDWPAAARHLERADELLAQGQFEVFPCHVRRAELRLRAARARFWWGQGELLRSEAEARRLLEQAALDPSREHLAIARTQLARIAAARGEPHAARALLDPALELLDRHPMPLVAFRTLALAASLYEPAGEAALARQALGRARALVEQIAEGIESDPLRSCFLESPAVRGVRFEGRED